MKKLIKSIAAVCLSAGMCLAFSACGAKDTDTSVAPDQAEQHSIMTKLDLSVSFDGDTATAKVKNSFTLFPAKARVYAYLYYSETYTDDYTEMKEVAQNFAEDLDIGETLTASYDTRGRGGYFLARMRYKIDSRDWEEKVTGVYEREYTKVILEPIEDDGSLPVFEDIEPAYPFLPEESYEEIYRRGILCVGEDLGIVSSEWGDINYLIEFENKILKEFNETIGKEFFILNPIDTYYGPGARYISYRIYQNNSMYILKKSTEISADEFGYAHPGKPDEPTGFDVCNIKLDLEFININENLTGKLSIKFGKVLNTDNKFINLYIGDFCIGTCYYDTDTIEEVPYSFFYNLFAEGLRIL